MATSLFSLILVIILNIVPADVSSFTVQAPEAGQPMHFTKQDDGGWLAKMGPGDEEATFLVKGTEITIKSEGDERSQDMGPLLGLDADTDWHKLEEVALGGGTIRIKRVDNGVDFALEDNEGKSVEDAGTVKVRWTRKK
ncbi:hypothetical protein [Sulfuriroseicoccus oceanibius]|uniref:Uncharacterized protein n=1 Tax=Sulfuriroseicoccus oceanibius TaxID=2707525 RepID=A0A6B3L833_9BACT|nr:hypothetical protein [Sulfuriroseicoccus oceanibius]QQL44803.1 hypothetical protein G3M56_013120 [Sulfuriroseicoccus oceanibius]